MNVKRQEVVKEEEDLWLGKRTIRPPPERQSEREIEKEREREERKMINKQSKKGKTQITKETD